jgi:hypothetical protein
MKMLPMNHGSATRARATIVHPATLSSTITSISFANALNEALESSFLSRMEHVDIVALISAADTYDAVVFVDVYLPPKWSAAAPSRIPGITSGPPPKDPVPLLRYRIERGRTVISSGNIMLDLPKWPPLEGTNVDSVFAMASEQLAIRVVRDLSGLTLRRPNPVTPPAARSR